VDFASLAARIKALTDALSRGQIVTLGLSFIGVVALVAGSALWITAPTYSLLFSDLDAESASQVVSRLEADQIPYRLEDGGRTVRVPQEQVDRLKIELAASVTSGRVGFEIFDRTAFGQTEFLEHVNYRRALEGELARTITSIAEVGTARVHIAMAKDSLFGSRQQPAKASVILKLKSSRPLAPASVAGIANLVAASVEGLRPESVVIIDNFGRPLSQTQEEGASPLGAEQRERQLDLERDLTMKVVSLLEPVVGIGRVRVNVSARLDNDSQEETEEIFDPNAVVRSRQVTTEGGPLLQAQGVAGARGNLPAAVAPNQDPAVNTASTAAAPGGAQATRSSETTNYEVSKVTRVTSRPHGDVARLSVAVLLDHEQVVTTSEDGTVARTSKPREPEAIQKIQELVAAAVGLDTNRGDQLTVENIAFSDSLDEAPPSSWTERVGPWATELMKVVAVLVLGILAFIFFVRPIVKQTTMALAPPRLSTAVVGAGDAGDTLGVGPQALPKTIEDLEGEIEAKLDAEAARHADPRSNVLTRRVQRLAEQNPEYAAKLLRSWLTEDARRR
jgi:flagellar M-ring protein FliF